MTAPTGPLHDDRPGRRDGAGDHRTRGLRHRAAGRGGWRGWPRTRRRPPRCER